MLTTRKDFWAGLCKKSLLLLPDPTPEIKKRFCEHRAAPRARKTSSKKKRGFAPLKDDFYITRIFGRLDR